MFLDLSVRRIGDRIFRDREMSIVVSVVVPTYRRPHLLKKCIDALLQQKFDKGSYEVIIISDGPDERTHELIGQWAGYDRPLLRLVELPEKKGPAAARNHGWKNAQGQIIAFTDDDCIPHMHWLQHIVANCDPEQDVALTGRVVVPLDNDRPTDHELNTANLQTADFITANCACTKKALEKAGGFDERFGMAWREDSDLHFNLIRNKIEIKKVKGAVVTHPVRAANWGVSIKDQKKTMYDALLYKKHPKLFRKKIRPISPLLYYSIILSFVLLLIGLVTGREQLLVVGIVAWLSFTTLFIYKRLATTDLSAKHVTEMVVTSLVIPFASVYWQWYGAIKYRVLFI